MLENDPLSLEMQSHLQGDEHWPLQYRSFQFVTDNQTLADQICGRATIDSRMKFQLSREHCHYYVATWLGVQATAR